MKEFVISCAGGESRILCGCNALSEIAKRAGRKMVFTDTNVRALYGDAIAACLPDTPVYAMPAGEEHKNETTLFALLSAMAAAQLHRGDTLLCIGGGVVGDVGGLASALYMRGIACVQVPTTLLAQVDSSVGGKTAIDFCGVKNLVGVFKQPESVLIDGTFLKTLPAREIRCGLGEIVKHAALDGALFDELLCNKDRLFDCEFLTAAVPKNVAIKADVVQKDPEEKGLRKCLNLGHTTAHAFELCDAKLSHGEYVLAGIVYEAEIAKTRVACDRAYLSELQDLARYALSGMRETVSARAAAEYAKLDKKNEKAAKIALTVPAERGKYALIELPYEEYCGELVRIQEKIK